DRLPVLLLCLHVILSKNSFITPPEPKFWPKADAKVQPILTTTKFSCTFFSKTAKIFGFFDKTHVFASSFSFKKENISKKGR
ncbi:MAG: hypothetical protein IKX22_07000, partial [Prevotella sp.]|nr:hypothetical protein [Prevotella sp.]